MHQRLVAALAAALLAAACVLCFSSQNPHRTALLSYKTSPVLTQALRELAALRTEIRTDRRLNMQFSRQDDVPTSLPRFHQLPQTSKALGMKVFAGSMLCGPGETSCEHPCETFHSFTDTEDQSDCTCKCTANPHSFYKEDEVICTCPDAPNYGSESDMYPFAEGEGPSPPVSDENVPDVAVGEVEEDSEGAPVPPMDGMTMDGAVDDGAAGEEGTEASPEDSGAAEAQELPEGAEETEGAGETDEGASAANQARVSGLVARRGARVPTGAKLPRVAVLQREITRQLAGMGIQQPRGAYAMAPLRAGGQGMYAPAPFLPPDGDYPGGSTGIPADGYIGFETGHGSQPYHGTDAPMQEAGIGALRAPVPPLWRGRVFRG
jgi:hypothetical protein